MKEKEGTLSTRIARLTRSRCGARASYPVLELKASFADLRREFDLKSC
jgi:hypothetical protein